MASCAQDASFGPGSTCRELDFTLYFEQTILSLSPDIIFIALAVPRLVYLRSQKNRLAHSTLSYALLALKAVAALFVVASTIASLVYSRNLPILSSSLGLAAPIIQIITAVLLTFLVSVEHFKSITPSTLVLAYAFIKGLFSAAIMRSSIQIGSSNTSTVLLALVTAAYLLQTLFELFGKRRALIDKDVPRISTSSVISRSLYLWLLPLMWHGRKTRLTIDDCGQIPHELGANASTTPLRNILVSIPKGDNYLVRASWKAFPGLFLSPVVPRLLLLLASFAQPLLVSRMITFISNPGQSSERGWALVGGFVCTYALIFLMTSTYWEKVFDCTVRYRGALVGNIYSKTLRLSSASGREVGGGVASTYMSVDVERVCQGLEVAHEIWAAFISIILAVALLYSQATWPAFLPLAITFLLVTMAGYVSKGVGGAHKAWLGSTDKRVKFLASIINNYLPMKLSNYEDAFAARSAHLRTQEMKGARAFYINITILGALSSTAWAACTLAVLGPYAGIASHHGPLNSERLFTIVTTVNLLSPPLTLLGTVMPQLRAATASLKRIEKYLSLEERTDLPVPLDAADDASEYSGEKKDDAPLATDVAFEAASFSWAADKPAFLGPLSVGLIPGYLHLCVGPVASGKTLFLLSVLGESVLTTGTFVGPGKPIAYAAQDPLIISGTIRENIVFGHEFSEGWYNTVLAACALTADIESLSGKDGTFLGEKGATLSGGQRQRISLARAIYAKAPWTLLDDSFSSLDAETEKHIFQSLFGPHGLLRNKSVVLVTHNAQHLNSADRVLVFNAGALQHQGTLDEIAASGYAFEREMQPKEEAAPSPEATTKSEVPATKPKAHVAQKESAETPIPKSSMGYTPYLFYMRMAGGSGSLLVIILLSLSGLIRLALSVYLQQWANSAGKKIGVWVGGYSVLVVCNFLFVAFGMWGFSLIITGPVGSNIHAAELRGLMQTSPSYFAKTPAGRIINRFSQDMFMCDLDFPRATFDVIIPAVILIGTLVFILIPTPWLTLTIPVLGAFYYMMLMFYLKTAKQFQQLLAASKSPLYTQFSTTLSGLITIRALGVEKHFQNQNDGHLDRSQVPFYLRFASMSFLRTFLALISFIMATGLSVLAVGLRHSTNASSLGLALASLTGMTGQLAMLLINLNNIENASIAVSRIHEIASLPKEQGPNEFPGKEVSSEKFDSSAAGSVVFENVRLQYGAELPPAVNGVSFRASPGQKIGVCGRSGSGKSSLIMALFRAVDPSLISGNVAVNGVDTQKWPLAKLRESMSLVAQNPFIWYAPLRQNLDPNGEYSDKDIWLTLERIGMSTAVSELPDKLETVLEDGGSLSSGQRQLLCLARILLRKTRIVVLDEASSSLDAESDKQIREVICTDLASSTVIAVAHRIETIVDFDLILVMEDGVLVESGSPENLLSRSDSKFAQLASSQGVSRRS
ncbi:P-loop containing nucleoside triphosphate hydrolase protein [Mycena albidolilacea]|uniref:P-loop containing nucleoside triphosphate hydrolase protein n=1 Tax=Mycena albidolilacea TaxID=1033008 RepID=A0AAD7F1C1_9AGAR|nr:P-loop containing nucleoside triphosphate hydrolase protein [Mycena albidolilacea]